MRIVLFVAYVLLGLAITNGVTVVLLLAGADISAAQGAGALTALVLILVLSQAVGISGWWAIAALFPVVVWVPIIKIAWRLSDRETSAEDYRAGYGG